MPRKRYFLILGFIFIGLTTRFLPHPPNFTAMNAIALFGATTIGSLPIAIATVFSALFLSDLALGIHPMMIFVYASFALTSIIGNYSHKRNYHPTICLLTSSLLFFCITNFGEWLINPMYAKNLSGLTLCYTMALPFLSFEILGTLVYGMLMFTAYERLTKIYTQDSYQ